jgi:hypothetical protein
VFHGPASRLVRLARKGDVANAALDGLDPRYGVHEPHGLDDHALVAESALEHDLSGRDFRIYAKGRGGAAESPIKSRLGRASLPAGAQAYKIVRVLPADGGEFQYRIKSAYETFERIARESELYALAV